MRNGLWKKGLRWGGGSMGAPFPDPPRYGIRMRVHDRYRQAQSRSAKQKSRRKALQ